MQSDKASCLNYADQIQKANPTLKIQAVIYAGYEIPYPAPAPAPVNQVCKVSFAGGASASSMQKDRAACFNYADQVQKANPTLKIISITFAGNPIPLPPPPGPQPPPPPLPVNQLCKVNFPGGASAASAQPARQACLNYLIQIQTNNPNTAVLTTEYIGNLIYVAPSSSAICKISFSAGGSAASTQSKLIGCINYVNEIKKNNPTLIISTIFFGNNQLYQK